MIAEFVSEELDIPVVNLIKRVRSTGHQTEREVHERIESMKKSPFICHPEAQPKDTLNSILLIDDVWTTGATINAAAQVLQNAGIDQIWKYTLAKG